MIRLAPQFAELAATTNFSFLRGASHPEEMVARAAELGLAGLGVADRNTLAGVVRAHVFARENRAAIGAMRVIAGARLVFRDEAPELVVYPETKAGYARLCRLLTRGNLRAPKGECHLDFAEALEDTRDLRVIAMPGGGRGEREKLLELREAFGAAPLGRSEPRLWRGDAGRAGAARETCARNPRAADRDQRCADACSRAAAARRRRRLHPRGRDPGGGGTSDAGQRRASSEGPARNGASVRRGAGSSRRDGEISSRRLLQPRRTRLQLSRGAARRFFEPAGRARSLRPGRRARVAFPTESPSASPRRSRHELDLVGQLNYAPYFLTVHDIVRFARSRGILCQGRGSAANSTLCYCLGITEVDPARFDLLFERFVSAERDEPPDIDVDFEHERRDEVIAYIYARYGRERAGLAAAVTTYRMRSAIRETAKVFGLSDDVIVSLNNTSWGGVAPIGD